MSKYRWLLGALVLAFATSAWAVKPNPEVYQPSQPQPGTGTGQGAGKAPIVKGSTQGTSPSPGAGSK